MRALEWRNYKMLPGACIAAFWERGQPFPREIDLKPGTRGHGCPRSNLESALPPIQSLKLALAEKPISSHTLSKSQPSPHSDASINLASAPFGLPTLRFFSKRSRRLYFNRVA